MLGASGGASTTWNAVTRKQPARRQCRKPRPAYVCGSAQMPGEVCARPDRRLAQCDSTPPRHAGSMFRVAAPRDTRSLYSCPTGHTRRPACLPPTTLRQALSGPDCCTGACRCGRPYAGSIFVEVGANVVDMSPVSTVVNRIRLRHSARPSIDHVFLSPEAECSSSPAARAARLRVVALP